MTDELINDESINDNDECAHGGEAHCCGCGKQQVMLYYKYNDIDGTLWLCEDCK